MAVVSGKVTLAAGASNSDIFSGFPRAQIPLEARNGASVRLLMTGGGDDVVATVQVGTRPVTETEALVSQETRTPREPEDVLVDAEPGAPTERVVANVRNTSAGSRDVRFILKITPL